MSERETLIQMYKEAIQFHVEIQDNDVTVESMQSFILPLLVDAVIEAKKNK